MVSNFSYISPSSSLFAHLIPEMCLLVYSKYSNAFFYNEKNDPMLLHVLLGASSYQVECFFVEVRKYTITFTRVVRGIQNFYSII